MQVPTRVVTMNGEPLTLQGNTVEKGLEAPDFEVLDTDLSTVKLSDYTGKVVIISSIPSLDTPVCDIQTRKFNEAAGGLSTDAVVLTISMDLPFAQKRWCGAAGIDNVQVLSDHRDASFGNAFGVLIKELRLLTRAVFVVDQDGTVCYSQIVDELTHEPDYDAALEAAGALL